MKSSRFGRLFGILTLLGVLSVACVRHKEEIAESQDGIQRNLHLIIDSELDKLGWTSQLKSDIESSGDILYAMASLALLLRKLAGYWSF